MADEEEKENGSEQQVDTTTAPPETDPEQELSETDQKIDEFYQGLDYHRQQGTLPEDLPDQETFRRAFKNPQYRQQMHNWLLMQQSQGNVSDIPSHYRKFNNHFFPQPEEPGPDEVEKNEYGEIVVDGVVAPQTPEPFDQNELTGRIRRIAEGDIEALENLNDLQTAQLAEELGLEKERLAKEINKFYPPVTGAAPVYKTEEDRIKDEQRQEVQRAQNILKRRMRDESSRTYLQKVANNTGDLLAAGTLSLGASVVAAKEMLTDAPEAQRRLTDTRRRMQQKIKSYSEGVAPVNFTEIGSKDGYVADAARWTTSQLVGAIPSMGSIMAGGYLGGKAGAPLGKPGMIAGSLIGSFSAAFTQMSGALYGDLIDMGADPDDAKRHALLYAAPAAGVEMIVPGLAASAILGAMGKNYTKKRIKEVLIGAGISTPFDGLAGGMSEAMMIAAEIDALGKEYTREEIADRVINSAAVEALAGLGAGAIGGAGRKKGTVDGYIDGFLNSVEAIAEPIPEMEWVRQQTEFKWWNPDASPSTQIDQLTAERKRLAKQMKAKDISVQDKTNIGYAVEVIDEQIHELKGGQKAEKAYKLANRPVVLNHLRRQLLVLEQDRGLTDTQRQLLDFLDDTEGATSNKAMKENVRITDEIIVEVDRRNNQKNLDRLIELNELAEAKESTFEEQLEMSAIIFNRPSVFEAFANGETVIEGENKVTPSPGVPTNDQDGPSLKSTPIGDRPVVQVRGPEGELTDASMFGDESEVINRISDIIEESDSLEAALEEINQQGFEFSEADASRIADFIQERQEGRQEATFGEWMESFLSEDQTRNVVQTRTEQKDGKEITSQTWMETSEKDNWRKTTFRFSRSDKPGKDSVGRVSYDSLEELQKDFNISETELEDLREAFGEDLSGFEFRLKEIRENTTDGKGAIDMEVVNKNDPLDRIDWGVPVEVISDRFAPKPEPVTEEATGGRTGLFDQRQQESQQKRDNILKEGTLGDVTGQRVTYGEYQGVLRTDPEGNFVVETNDGTIVEVAESMKDPSKNIADLGLERSRAQLRNMRLNDFESGSFTLEETNPETGEVSSESFTFEASNTNDAGEVVSVTMRNAEGQQRVFRQPEIVEQVIWQNYFSQAENVQSDLEGELSGQTTPEQAPEGQGPTETITSPDELPSYTLDDGDPRLDRVFDKFEAGEKLTQAEQEAALDWASEKIDELTQANPNNLADLLDQLEQFENEVITNEPQQTPDLGDPATTTPEDAVPEPGPGTEATPTGTTTTTVRPTESGGSGRPAGDAGATGRPAPQPPGPRINGEPEPPPTTDQPVTVEQALEAAPIEMQSLDEYLSRVHNELDELFQQNPASANRVINELRKRHKQFIAQAIEDGQAVPESALKGYPDLAKKMAIDESSTAPEETKPVRPVTQLTREYVRLQLQEQVDAGNITQAQVEALMQLLDTRAEIWAKQNRRSKDDYYRSRFNNFKGTNSDTVNDIVRTYNGAYDSIDGILDADAAKLNQSIPDNTASFINEDGDRIHYQSNEQGDLFDSTDPSPIPKKSPPPSVETLEGGEFIQQERVFDIVTPLELHSSKTKIGSAEDVAWMFHALESQAVEHFFYVLVDADGTPTIIHAGMGGKTAAIVDVDMLNGLISEFNPTDIYAVHNHPAGTLKASTADVKLLSKMSDMAVTYGVNMHGVIINKDSGHYVEFFEDNVLMGREATRQIAPVKLRLEEIEQRGLQPLEIKAYNRFRFLENPMESLTAADSQSVAEILDRKKLSLKDKDGVLITDNGMNVRAFLHLRNPLLTKDGYANPEAQKEIASYVVKFGGTGSILVTNRRYDLLYDSRAALSGLVMKLKRLEAPVHDIISVSPAPNSLAAESYASLRNHYEDAIWEPETTVYHGRENEQTFATSEQAIQYLFENETSFEEIVNNLSRVFVKDLTGNDRLLVEKWAGAKDGVWNQGAYDTFSQGLTEYLAEGSAPTTALQKVFAKFKEWLNGLYQTFTENDSLVLNDDIRGVFDRLFTGTIEDLRNNPIKPNQLGKEIKVDWKPDGSESHSGRFAVIELADLQASHYPNGHKNERHIISRAQPRDRSSEQAKQDQERRAQTLNPAYNTGNSGTAFDSSPVVNQYGEAIQGNGRIISLNIAQSNYPAKFNEYKQYVVEHAEQWGLDRAAVESMKQPVVVRMLEVSDTEAVRLGSIQDERQLKTPDDQVALAAIRQMSMEDKRVIGAIIENSQEETFRAVLDDVGIQILDKVLDNRQDYIDKRGNITVKGKDFLEDVFKALVFDSEINENALKVFSDSHHNLQVAIGKNYGTLLRFYDTPADLRNNLHKGLEIVLKVQRNPEHQTVDDYFNTVDAFENPSEMYTETDRIFAEVLFDSLDPSSEMMKSLNTKSPTVALTQIFKDYKDQIYGRNELFEENTIEPKGNTEEGANAAFLEAFNRRAEPKLPEQTRQEPEPGGPDTGEGSQGEILSQLAPEKVTNEVIDKSTSEPKEQLLMAGYLPKIVNNLRKKGPKKKEIVSRQDITNHIIEKFKVAVNVGRHRGLLNALGFYRLRPYGHAIRLRVANDISVLAHEVGHYLHDVLFDAGTHSKFDRELMPLGARTSREDYSPDQVRMEGQAEFFRYLITDQETAKKLAPTYFDFFAEAVNKDPLIRRAVDEVTAMISGYVSQDGPTRLRSQIAYDDQSPTKTAPQEETVPQYLYRMILDDLIPLQRAREELLTEKNEIDSEQVATDAFRLAQLAKGIPGLIQGWMEFGVRNTSGEKIHKGLAPILREAGIETSADRRNFEDYLVARRSIELYEQAERGERELAGDHGQEGGALGISKQDAEETFAKFNSPQFEKAAQEIYGWTRATLEWVVERGYMDRKQVDAMLEMNQNYIPMHRVMDHLDAKAAGKKSSMVNKPTLWQKIRGSGRRILPPLTTLVRNTQRMVQIAEQNYAAVQMFEDIRSAKKGGVFADQTSRQVKPVTGRLSDIKKALEEAGIDQDLIEELDLETSFTLFQPLGHNPAKREVMIRRNGKPEIWQVHNDALYDTLVANSPKTNRALSKILTGPKNVFRTGVIISLNFVMSALQRDQFVAHAQSRYGYAFVHLNPFKEDFGTSDYFKGMMAILRNSEEYQLWLQSRAGISGIVDVGGSADQVGRTLDNLQQNDIQRIVKNIIFPTRWLQGLEAFSALTENSTRVGEFMRGIEVEGRDEEGLMRAAISSREIAADYARGGQWAKAVGRYKAFLNAGLQGDLSMAQAIKRDPVGFAIRGVYSMALPTLALNYAMAENEDYMEREEERRAYWLIPLGDPRTTTDWFKVRKPWRLGSFFGTIFPEALEIASGTNDGTILQDMFPGPEDALSVAMDLLPSAVLPLLEVQYNYNSFFQRNIDPYYELQLEPYLRYDDRNSEVEKQLGKVLNMSPRRIRHLIRGFAGTVGVDASDLSGELLADIMQNPEDPPLPETDPVQDIPGVQVFFSKDISAGRSKSFQQFYKLLDQSRTKRRSYTSQRGTPEGQAYLEENQDLINLNPSLERTNRRISDIRDRVERVYLSQSMTPEEKRDALRGLNSDIIELSRLAVRQFEGQVGTGSRTFSPIPQ